MNSDYYEIEEITQLEYSFLDRHTGKLLAKHFEKLVKREYSELVQMEALRRDLSRLQSGPERKAIATKIREYTASHARRIRRHAAMLVADAAGEESA